MGLILNLESATNVCSVALAMDGELLHSKEDFKGPSHASNINLFIQQVMSKSNYRIEELDAVAISSGPGSYTGLRIGLSTAKGLCYSCNVPLIAIPTLKALAYGLIKKNNLDIDLFLTCLDNRREEVIYSIYDYNLNAHSSMLVHELNSESFQNLYIKNKILIGGTGALKTKKYLNHKNVCWDMELMADARNMCHLSEKKFAKDQFEDLAYFEPTYGKEFYDNRRHLSS